MKIIKDFDESIFLDIAKASGVKQTVADIGYAKFCYYHSKDKRYAERIDEDAWILGVVNKDSLRIIGMATRQSAQGKGYGTLLLKRAIAFCRQKGLKKITTRTFSGKKFYQKKGKAVVVGMKDGDYLMEINISGKGGV